MTPGILQMRYLVIVKVFAVDPSVLKEKIYGEDCLAGDKKGVCGICKSAEFQMQWTIYHFQYFLWSAREVVKLFSSCEP